MKVLSSRRRQYNCTVLFEYEMRSGTSIGF
jgi:hypothetical protein